MEVVFNYSQDPVVGFTEDTKVQINQSFPLEDYVNRVLKRCDRDLSVDCPVEVTFLSYDKPTSVDLPCWGEVHYGLGVDIGFYTSKLDYVTRARKLLSGVLAHEYGHFARYKFTGKESETLADSIMHEGIATHFQMRMYPGILFPYADHSSVVEKDWLWLSKQAAGQMHRPLTSELYYKWVYGKGRFPNMSAHMVGSYLVDSFVRNRKPCDYELITAKCEEILKSPQYHTSNITSNITPRMCDIVSPHL